MISGTGKSRLIGAEAVETTRPGDGDAEVPFDEGDGACAAAAPFCKGCCEAEGAETAASISWAEAEPRPPAEAAAAARRRPAVASLPRPLRPRRGGGARLVIFFSSIFSLCSICLIRSGKRAQEEEEIGGNGPALRERGERAGKKRVGEVGRVGFFFLFVRQQRVVERVEEKKMHARWVRSSNRRNSPHAPARYLRFSGSKRLPSAAESFAGAFPLFSRAQIEEKRPWRGRIPETLLANAGEEKRR